MCCRRSLCSQARYRPYSATRPRYVAFLAGALHANIDPPQLSRPQTVKKIWEHIRAHDLQDANDKRMIRCDEPMRAVFKQDKIHMFTMNKVLNQNLYAVDE